MTVLVVNMPTVRATSTEFDDLTTMSVVKGRYLQKSGFTTTGPVDGMLGLFAVFTAYPTVRPRVPENLRYPARSGE
jgi:hypothetical protein